MKKKILIVEDSYVVSYLVQNLINENFNAEGYWINDSNSISSKLLAETSLVIMDHFIHDHCLHEHFNGITLAERVKKFNKKIPIILFSGCKPDQIKEIYWKKVIDHYISKNDPDYLPKLIQRIQKYVA